MCACCCCSLAVLCACCGCSLAVLCACCGCSQAVLCACCGCSQAVLWCLSDGLLLAGHDVSDGGLIGSVLEMAFAGNCGVKVDIPAAATGMEKTDTAL